jgi:hypothetical protein
VSPIESLHEEVILFAVLAYKTYGLLHKGLVTVKASFLIYQTKNNTAKTIKFI